MTNIRVTEEQVQENMQDVIVRTMMDFDKPCTYVTVRMKNGFTLRESTTCVDPENYDESIGAQICLDKIKNKIWLLLGFALQEKIANTPKDYKERMKKEFEELSERHDALLSFMQSDKFAEIPVEKRILMENQYNYMLDYKMILRQRCEMEGIEID